MRLTILRWRSKPIYILLTLLVNVLACSAIAVRQTKRERKLALQGKHARDFFVKKLSRRTAFTCVLCLKDMGPRILRKISRQHIQSSTATAGPRSTASPSAFAMVTFMITSDQIASDLQVTFKTDRLYY